MCLRVWSTGERLLVSSDLLCWLADDNFGLCLGVYKKTPELHDGKPTWKKGEKKIFFSNERDQWNIAYRGQVYIRNRSKADILPETGWECLGWVGDYFSGSARWAEVR